MIPPDAYRITIGLFKLRLCPIFNKICLNTCPRKNTTDCKSYFFVLSTLFLC